MLRFAAAHADIVSITGLGRTLSDGHRHEVDWSTTSLHRTLETLRAAAGAAERRPRIEALVQVVEITDDAERTANTLLSHAPGATADDLLEAPYAWIGTTAEISNKLERLNDLGVDRYVIREAAIPTVRRIQRAIE